MTKSETISNPDSCLNRAIPDEPIFVLRAHDPLAAYIVASWAAHYFNQKGGHAAMTPRQLEKYREARRLAKQMEDWQRAHPNDA